MKNNFYARKRRQLKFRLKRFKQFSAQHSSSSQFQKLRREIRSLIHELRFVINPNKLKKMVGVTALLLGLTFGDAHAQQFGKRIANAFGITNSTQVEIPELADLDGDGDLDILAGNYFGEFEFYQNIGNEVVPNFQEPLIDPFELANGFDINLPRLADMDGDGDLDILSWSNGWFAYFQNNGNATVPLFSGDPIDNPFGLNNDLSGLHTLADLDGDGDIDILASNYNTYGIQFIENIGDAQNPQFSGAVDNPFGISEQPGYLVFPELVDLDLDGDLDYLRVNYGGQFGYQQNIGTATEPNFGEMQILPFGLVSLESGFSWITTGDLDGDGDYDLLTGEYGDDMGYWELLSSVSSKEIFEEKSLLLYPNPASSELFIESDQNIIAYEIYDFTGKLIQRSSLIDKSISLVSLKLGVYILKLETEKNEYLINRFEKI